jgi:hypothetical protein
LGLADSTTVALLEGWSKLGRSEEELLIEGKSPEKKVFKGFEKRERKERVSSEGEEGVLSS